MRNCYYGDDDGDNDYDYAAVVGIDTEDLDTAEMVVVGTACPVHSTDLPLIPEVLAVLDDAAALSVLDALVSAPSLVWPLVLNCYYCCCWERKVGLALKMGEAAQD